MIVCLAGMHRSGTSMVARLLNRCGLDLGDEDDLLPPRPDNPDGFWEHREFVALNDAVLDALGGSWDVPPPDRPDWARDPVLLPLRHRALALVGRFPSDRPWGWKDPRNSLTLPLWRLLVPDLRIVVCVRNPLAVVQSLADRAAHSRTFGLQLWRTYHARLLAAVPPEARIVTHYDAWFQDAPAELRRICARLGLTATSEATDVIRGGLRHHRQTTADLIAHLHDSTIVDTYLRLCAEAGPVYAAALEREPVPAAATETLAADAGAPLDALLRVRLVHLERELAERDAQRASLAARVDALAARVATQERELQLAESRQRADRDIAARATVTLTQREQELAQLRSGLVDVREQLERVTSSRLWPMMQALWRLRVRFVPPDSLRERMLGMEPRKVER